MPPKHFWTPAQDEILRTHRTNRQSWSSIAHSLGTTPDVARERARAIGIRRATAPHTTAVHESAADPDREPLPPGHPVSWSALTEGTLLDGTTCPWPPLPLADATADAA